jgi:hypothetical protein
MGNEPSDRVSGAVQICNLLHFDPNGRSNDPKIGKVIEIISKRRN